MFPSYLIRSTQVLTVSESYTKKTSTETQCSLKHFLFFSFNVQYTNTVRRKKTERHTYKIILSIYSSMIIYAFGYIFSTFFKSKQKIDLLLGQ